MLISKFDTDGIEQKVAEFEEKHAITLPEQYRRFLLRYNGGETPETSFKMGRQSSVIRAFYGIGDVVYSFSSIEEFLPDLLKKQFLPIARDVFGNYIVIDLDEEKNGRILFCDHEKGFKATCLAEDLKEFVTKAKSKKITEDYTRPIAEREKRLIANGHGDNITDGLRRMWQEEIDKYSNIKQERVVID